MFCPKETITFCLLLMWSWSHRCAPKVLFFFSSREKPRRSVVKRYGPKICALLFFLFFSRSFHTLLLLSSYFFYYYHYYYCYFFIYSIYLFINHQEQQVNKQNISTLIQLDYIQDSHLYCWNITIM